MKTPASPQKLSRDLRLMILLNALRKVSDLFLGTFLISFIMKLSGNEMVAVGLYMLFQYVAAIAGFFLFANQVKRHNKVTVLRLNLIPKIILLASIIALGENVVEYVVPLGILYGINMAMYHLPMNTMLGEKASSKQMSRYISLNSVINHLVKVVSPVLLGLFITTSSYIEMSWALLVLVVVELVSTLFMSSSRHRSKNPIDFIGFFNCMMRFPIIRAIFAMEILRGFTISGALGTIITMYTVYMFDTDLNLGILTTLFSLCAIIVCWCMGRYVRQKMYASVLTICMFIIAGTMGGFLIWTTPLMFLLYRLMDSTAIQSVDQICNVNAFNMSKSKCVTANHKVEYFVFRDMALFIGRWIGYVGLIYIGVFGGYACLRWYLAVITVAVLVLVWLAGKISPHIRGR